MKTMYFEKIENKYVFNVSRIFWHIFIFIGTLAIVLGIFLFLYGLIPPFKKHVEKSATPTKQAYPNAITVSLSDLKLEEIKPVKKEIVEKESEIVPETPMVDNTKKIDPAELDYQNSLKILQKLLPAKGHYEYPLQNGERLYKYTHDEKYRVFKDDNDVEGKLKNAFSNNRITTFPEKKQLVDAFAGELKLLPENKRTGILNVFIVDMSNNVSNCIRNTQTAMKIYPKFPDDEQINSLAGLLKFAKFNPKDGSAFLDYFNKTIDRLDTKERANTLAAMVNAYYQYFNNNIAVQTEQTDLFLTMLSKIKPEMQSQALGKYYSVYAEKNAGRERTIAQIDQQYIADTVRIAEKYMNDLSAAEYKYLEDKQKKSDYRNKAIYGIGSGFILVAFIAIILVFLSIQRSVRKIEEKLTSDISVDKTSN